MRYYGVPHHTIFHYQGNTIFHGLRGGRNAASRDFDALVEVNIIQRGDEQDKFKVCNIYDQ